MKVIAFLTLLATLLMAGNPKVYSALGNMIYNNVDSISKLQELESYDSKGIEIIKYIKNVSQTKDRGFAIDNGDKSMDKLSYLEEIRKLSKENDSFFRAANSSFKLSIKNEDNQLFSQIINTGLIDTQKYKDEIIDYYMFHTDDINSSGFIQGYFDEADRLERLSKMKKYRFKKQIQAEKINRLRKSDMEKQAKVENSLQEEVNRKKVEIRINQKKELAL